MKPEVIVRIEYPDFGLKMLKEHFTVHYAPTPEEFESAIDAHGEVARALVTNGSVGVTGDQLQRLKAVEIIHTRGVGVENVHVPTVKERGMVLVTSKGTNSFSVADHAMTLLLRHRIAKSDFVSCHRGPCLCDGWPSGSLRAYGGYQLYPVCGSPRCFRISFR